MRDENYPILSSEDCIREAMGWIDRADDIIGSAFVDAKTGEHYPVPPELDAAQELWQAAWKTLGEARSKLAALVKAEKERYDADDDYYSRGK